MTFSTLERLEITAPVTLALTTGCEVWSTNILFRILWSCCTSSLPLGCWILARSTSGWWCQTWPLLFVSCWAWGRYLNDTWFLILICHFSLSYFYRNDYLLLYNVIMFSGETAHRGQATCRVRQDHAAHDRQRGRQLRVSNSVILPEQATPTRHV